MILLEVLYMLVLLWVGLSVVYITTNALFAFNYKNPVLNKDMVYPNSVVLIPTYKDDAVIYDTALKASLHLYRGNFDVVVIADSLSSKTLTRLKYLNVKVIEVAFDQSTKSKALNDALSKLGKDYSFAVVLDSDNIMQKGFLNKMAESLEGGFKIVQGHRTAKNMKSNIAFLDAVSEEVNNHIYSKGPVALGLSSRIAGSAFACDYSLFKSTMKEVNAVGGFDKELELKFIKQGFQIGYNHNAIVLDEKVKNKEVYRNQRRRWLSSQYFYLRKNFLESGKQIIKGNFDYAFKYFQLALPPRLFVPILSFILFALSSFFGNTIFFISAGVFLLSIVAYLLSIPSMFYTSRLIVVLKDVVNVIIQTFLALLGLKGANKKFIHTPHSN